MASKHRRIDSNLERTFRRSQIRLLESRRKIFGKRFARLYRKNLWRGVRICNSEKGLTFFYFIFDFFRPHSSLCGRFFVLLFLDFGLLFLGFGDFV